MAPSMLLRVAGPSPRLSRSVVDSPWLSTILRMILQTLDRVGRGPIAVPEQGAFSEGNLHFREVSSPATSGLIQLLIAYLTWASGIAQPRGRYAGQAMATSISASRRTS